MQRQKIRFGIVMSMFCLFPAVFYYLSPYLIIAGTIERTVSGSFILFVAQFFVSIFFGRVFCGWACPAAGAQEAFAKANDRAVRRGDWLKWGIWAIWLATIVSIAFIRRGYAKVDPLYKTYYGFSVTDINSLVTYLMVLAIIVIPSLVVGRRSFCHHLCWMAPFMILGERLSRALRLPRFRIVTIPGNCAHCHLCTKNCPMSLEVEALAKAGEIRPSECVKCLNCVDVCKFKVFNLKFNSGRGRL